MTAWKRAASSKNRTTADGEPSQFPFSTPGEDCHPSLPQLDHFSFLSGVRVLGLHLRDFFPPAFVSTGAKIHGRQPVCPGLGGANSPQ